MATRHKGPNHSCYKVLTWVSSTISYKLRLTQR
ncbi:hypothetical protein [Sulfolobus tengchongensis spindle-shaped virus 4]|nr:hypothetical protein [Sulfolobus tengchongensis spindle-shaped virus 4]